MTEQNHWVRPQERPFVRRVEDAMNQVSTSHTWYITDFLTPREQVLISSIVHSRGLTVAYSGGYDGSERQRALIMPDNWYPQSEDFAIVALSVVPFDGQVAFSHGEVMGSVLGTGIDRKVVGDIVIAKAQVYIFVKREMSNHLIDTLSHVGRSTVEVRQAAIVEGIEPPSYEVNRISVASLRLDAVIAASCHISRDAAQTKVSKGQVKLNFIETDKPDESVAVGDLVSVHGFGRVEITNFIGESKKSRQLLEVHVMKSKH